MSAARAVAVKICGLRAPEALAAAVGGGARGVGFVFYPPSPRHVSVAEAAALAAHAPPGVERVGVFVDPDDALLAEARDRAGLTAAQLHGAETPRRVAGIRERFGLAAIKAIPVARAEDLARAGEYAGAASRLMFDARPPAGAASALPGGNGLAFDWKLLAGRAWPLPWVLSGGLAPDNVAEAVEETGARAVDVSSGVESAPGVKDPALIAAFFAALEDAPARA